MNKFKIGDIVSTHSGNNKGTITNIRVSFYSDKSYYSYQLDSKDYFWQEDSLVMYKEEEES